jgi:hypothetical protein
MGHQLNQKAFFQNGEMTVVLLRGRNVTEEMQEILWGFIKEHYIFPFEQEKIDKNATMKIIYNALRRFRHALNKYYVQCHRLIGLGISHQTNGTHLYNNIPLHKP